MDVELGRRIHIQWASILAHGSGPTIRARSARRMPSPAQYFRGLRKLEAEASCILRTCRFLAFFLS